MRHDTMCNRREHTRSPRLVAGLLPLLLAAGVPALAQESAAPVRKELDAFREKASQSAPADRMRAYEQGIEEVRKSGVLDRALKVGDRAPDFELPDANGKMVRLSELRASGPVVLTWYRGGWCPYCNIALRGFQKRLPDFRAAGATLVAISPELPDHSMSTAEKGHLEFEVLSDRGSKVARAYGVAYKIPRVTAEQFRGRLDLAKYNGDEGDELPLGATYLVDRGGIIRYAFIDADYRRRAEPADVLAAIRGLEAKP